MSESLVQDYKLENFIKNNSVEGFERVFDYFADHRTLRDVREQMPAAEYIPLDGQEDRAVQLVHLEPDVKDYDESRAIALGLPFLNGYTPHHFIRAKTLQLLMGPEIPVWIMPNNSSKDTAYALSDSDRIRLATGNFAPIGEMEMRAFNTLHITRNLGTLSITGYSQGGLTALAMGAAGSDLLHVDRINADEAPSKETRSAKELQKDFMSGNMFDVPDAAKDSDIDALTEAMSRPRFIVDVLRFAIEAQRKNSKLIHHAMAGDISKLAVKAAGNVTSVKLGMVKDSPMFDPKSIKADAPNITLARYSDAPFTRGHGTGDNPIAHALMAKHGLQ